MAWNYDDASGDYLHDSQILDTTEADDKASHRCSLTRQG